MNNVLKNYNLFLKNALNSDENNNNTEQKLG